MDLVVVTGLSGGGKSRAVNVLEDFEYYCVDNMPVSMIPKFAELCLAAGGKYDRTAVVTDVRAIDDFSELFRAGLSYTGSSLKWAAVLALIVGVAFLGIGIYQDVKNTEKK